MKRRQFVGALMAGSTMPALLAQQGGTPRDSAADAPAPLQFATADDAADPVLKFLDRRQFETLARVGDLLQPAYNGAPSARQARVAEFLDFLLGESMPEYQRLYINGLDQLEYQSQLKFRRAFAATSDAEADQLMAGLKQAWTYAAPDPVVAFLRQAKEDFRQATFNSREYSRALEASGGRAFSGQYWLKVD